MGADNPGELASAGALGRDPELLVTFVCGEFMHENSLLRSDRNLIGGEHLRALHVSIVPSERMALGRPRHDVSERRRWCGQHHHDARRRGADHKDARSGSAQLSTELRDHPDPRNITRGVPHDVQSESEPYLPLTFHRYPTPGVEESLLLNNAETHGVNRSVTWSFLRQDSARGAAGLAGPQSLESGIPKKQDGDDRDSESLVLGIEQARQMTDIGHVIAHDAPDLLGSDRLVIRAGIRITLGDEDQSPVRALPLGDDPVRHERGVVGKGHEGDDIPHLDGLQILLTIDLLDDDHAPSANSGLHGAGQDRQRHPPGDPRNDDDERQDDDGQPGEEPQRQAEQALHTLLALLQITTSRKRITVFRRSTSKVAGAMISPSFECPTTLTVNVSRRLISPPGETSAER